MQIHFTANTLSAEIISIHLGSGGGSSRLIKPLHPSLTSSSGDDDGDANCWLLLGDVVEMTSLNSCLH